MAPRFLLKGTSPSVVVPGFSEKRLPERCESLAIGEWHVKRVSRFGRISNERIAPFATVPDACEKFTLAPRTAAYAPAHHSQERSVKSAAILILALTLASCSSSSPSGVASVPTNTAAPTVATSPTTPPTRGPNCDAAYPTVCIPPPPPDLDCKDIKERRFKVVAPDPHRFDSDGNGIGCEGQ